MRSHCALQSLTFRAGTAMAVWGAAAVLVAAQPAARPWQALSLPTVAEVAARFSDPVWSSYWTELQVSTRMEVTNLPMAPISAR